MGAKLYTIDKISEQQHTHDVYVYGYGRARGETRPRARPRARRPGGLSAARPGAPRGPEWQRGRARARGGVRAPGTNTVIHTNNRDALIRAEC